MIVGDLMPVVSARLAVLPAEASAQLAAAVFSRGQFGLLVICDADGIAVGVVSKSDLVGHLARSGPATASVAKLMTHTVISCAAGERLTDAWEVMKQRRLQNMPVVDNGRRPVGVLDIRDALQAILRQEQDQERLLVNYIGGIGYR